MPFTGQQYHKKTIHHSFNTAILSHVHRRAPKMVLHAWNLLYKKLKLMKACTQHFERKGVLTKFKYTYYSNEYIFTAYNDKNHW